MLEAQCRLPDDLARFGHRQRAALADGPRQVGAVDVLHDAVVAVAELVRVEHLDDVGVLGQFPECQHLLIEPSGGGRVVELLLADHLERHVAAHEGVVGLVHAAHPALTEDIEEAVPVGAVPVGDEQRGGPAPCDFLDLERRQPPPAADLLGHCW